MGCCKESDALAEGRARHERLSTSKEQDEQLVPGIPDEITLEHISTKLAWGALCILSTVCRAWKQAIQSRRVFDARVLSNTTETLLVHYHRFHCLSRECNYLAIGHSRIALYSVRDNCCYELPPIPQLHIGAPWDSELISLEGTLYVVGGEGYMNVHALEGCKNVYALDLMGQRKWKQCASMQHGRGIFRCGLVGEKIYVFGGCCQFRPVLQVEVYDPKVNAWSPVKSRPTTWWESTRFAALGEELLLFHAFKQCTATPEFQDGALHLEAYHPIRDEWRTVYPSEDLGKPTSSGIVFMSEGKFYLMTHLRIYVHNSDNNSWRDLHSNSYPVNPYTELASGVPGVFPYAVVAIHDELLMGATWYISNANHTGLFRSKGFCSQSKKIVWEGTSCVQRCDVFAACTIEL